MTKAKQDWSYGKKVKVGFMTFFVIERVATPGDHKPDYYRLMNTYDGEPYTFTPHHGLAKGWP